MQLDPVLRPSSPNVPSKIAAPTGPEIPADPQDTATTSNHSIGDEWTAARFLAYGSINRLESNLNDAKEAKKHPLEELPTPQIERPFVLVPGWTTKPEAFKPLASFLTRDSANGGQVYFVKEGHFFQQNTAGELEPLVGTPEKGRVFEMVWTDTRQAPEKNLPEMRQNLDAITKATGFAKVDAQGYSMGGLDTRLYLEEGGNQINNFMMLGTPNHGTSFGSLVAYVLDHDIGWAQKFSGVSSKDAGSMHWLRDEAESPELQKLNADWAKQAAQVKNVLIVGTNDLETPQSKSPPLGLGKGDGTVPAVSLGLPNAKTVLINEPMSHGSLNRNEHIEQLRADFFGWKLS